MEPFFSIIVVCLNPGKKLKSTLASIAGQTFQDYQVIVKDGLSSDGSLACIEEIFSGSQQKLRLIQKKDQGIYDAMNQAVGEAGGRYIYFLNCGDLFADESVLKKMAAFISEKKGLGIYYGDIRERVTGQRVASNPHMDDFGCYRNVPCHQACFYSRELLLAHPFDISYKVRADYEQFLWCYFVGMEGKGTEFDYQSMVIADYEGGGFSETKENRRISASEHRKITSLYMSRGQLFKFRMILLLTLAPLRTWMAGNPRTAGIYNDLKKRLYAGKDS